MADTVVSEGEAAAANFSFRNAATIVNGKRKSADGPVKWCNQCHRKHPSRKVCDLYLRSRTTKTGSKQMRWCH